MQEVCNSVSEDSGLNDALKLARRVENDGAVASAALELSGSWATPGTAMMVVQDELYMPMSNVLLYSCRCTATANTSACMYKILRACGAPVLETEGLRASQPVSKKLGPNPALSF